jgi:hypothetical protein
MANFFQGEPKFFLNKLCLAKISFMHDNGDYKKAIRAEPSKIICEPLSLTDKTTAG